ncbi:MAG: alpha/beta hydrolase [Rhodospirillales bacterium]
MNETELYHGYDRAALDAQYDNRARHPEHTEIHAAWTADGEAVLADIGHRLDVAYGPSAEETLDIYLPGDAERAPINVFLHGGYWYSRDKDDFRFIARGVVPGGGVSVVVNYALVPSVDLDELVRQCRAAIAWTYANAESFGGDRDRLFVSGHSAGGHLTAMMLATDWPAFADGLPRDLVKGGTAVSGIYDLAPIRLCYLQDTLGLTEDQAERLSPLAMTPATDGPLIVAVGGGETEEFIRHAEALAGAWGKAGADCRMMVRPGLNHFTILGELADGSSALGRAVLDQMGLG